MRPVKQPSFPGAVDRLLREPPFALSEDEKRPLFSAAMAEAFRHHFEHNEIFRTICRKEGFSAESIPEDLSRLPYVPASLFKKGLLLSVPAGRIAAEIRSSATSGPPSLVAIDPISARRQSLVSSRVMAEYLGHHRRPFLILDVDPAALSPTDILARSAATRGFLVFADSVEFALEEDGGGLRLDEARLARSLESLQNAGRDVCIFGFTHLLYTQLIRPLKTKGRSLRLPPGSRVAHIGGWKRLRAEQVDGNRFLEDTISTLGIPEDNIVDFYGFTEQMGIVYAGQGRAPKTVHAYAEIIVRDFETLQPAPDGKTGLLQFLTPIPHSHPGISILTEDVGRIVGRGRDGLGRWGAQFEVVGRAEKAEPRGCGDQMPPVGG
jgi:hypothetical protein